MRNQLKNSSSNMATVDEKRRTFLTTKTTTTQTTKLIPHFFFFVYIHLFSSDVLYYANAMKIRRPWTTKHWCESVIHPEWPFAYSKYGGQVEETKGRVSSSLQDVRHGCETQGVQSKCHICEKSLSTALNLRLHIKGIHGKENIPFSNGTKYVQSR